MNCICDDNQCKMIPGMNLKDPDGNFYKECVNCGDTNEELFEDLSDSNVIRIQRPNFPGGWIFMNPDELSKCYDDDYGIICNSCISYNCDPCKNKFIFAHNGTGIKLFGLCVNLCVDCHIYNCDEFYHHKAESDCNETTCKCHN